MAVPIPREFGVATTINFDLYEVDGIDINATASCVIGDVSIMQDDGASAVSTNLFSAQALGHTIALTAEEMSAARIVVRIIDQDSTKEWLDKFILVETYGTPTSQYGVASEIKISTTINTLTTQLSFTLLEGSEDDDTYNGDMIIITDASTNTQKATSVVSDYDGGTKTITLISDPAIFTMAAGDLVDIISTPRQLPNGLPGLDGGLLTVDDNNFIAGIQGDDANTLDDVLSVLPTTDFFPTNFGSLSITAGGGVVVASGTLGTAAYTSAAQIALTYDWCALPDFSADRSTINALRLLRNKWNIAGSTMSVYKENDSTIAWQSDLSTVASANSIVDFDPT